MGEGGRADVVSALTSAVSTTLSKPALHHATCALAWRLGTHPSTHTEHGFYTELSVSYLSRFSGVSIGTAHSAWKGLVPSLPIRKVHRYDLPGLGITPRKLKRGQRWGQHLLIADEVMTDLRAFSDALVRSDTWAPPGAAFDSAWTKIRLVQRGSRWMAHCPFHNDRHPSMLINMNDDGTGTGWGVCMSCTANGSRLAVFARRSRDGWECKLSRRSARSRAPLRGGVERLHSPIRSGSLPPGSLVLGRLDQSGLTGRISSSPDLLSLLRFANRSVNSDSAYSKALEASAYYSTGLDSKNHPLQYLPDRLVSASEMRIAEWKEFPLPDGRTGFLPSKFSPVRQTWTLFDIDELHLPSTLPSKSKMKLWSGVCRSLRDSTLHDGAFAIVQTSTTGLQIWARLETPHCPSSFFSSWRNQNHLREVGRRLQTLSSSEGYGFGVVDRSSFAPGRYGRRPGWRLTKDGQPFASRLLARSG